MPAQVGVGGGRAVAASDAHWAPIRSGGSVASEELLAAAALDELPQRGTILLDAGAVSERVARLLPDDCSLTVVTNSVPVARALIDHDEVTALLIGGRFERGVGATVGGHSTAGLEGLEIEVAFMTADGVSADRGLTTRFTAESDSKRMMIRAADRVVLLAPGERIGHIDLARFGSLSDVDCLVTDSACDSPAGRRVAVGVPRWVHA